MPPEAGRTAAAKQGVKAAQAAAPGRLLHSMPTPPFNARAYSVKPRKAVEPPAPDAESAGLHALKEPACIETHAGIEDLLFKLNASLLPRETKSNILFQLAYHTGRTREESKKVRIKVADLVNNQDPLIVSKSTKYRTTLLNIDPSGPIKGSKSLKKYAYSAPDRFPEEHTPLGAALRELGDAAKAKLDDVSSPLDEVERRDGSLIAVVATMHGTSPHDLKMIAEEKALGALRLLIEKDLQDDKLFDFSTYEGVCDAWGLAEEDRGAVRALAAHGTVISALHLKELNEGSFVALEQKIEEFGDRFDIDPTERGRLRDPIAGYVEDILFNINFGTKNFLRLSVGTSKDDMASLLKAADKFSSMIGVSRDDVAKKLFIRFMDLYSHVFAQTPGYLIGRDHSSIFTDRMKELNGKINSLMHQMAEVFQLTPDIIADFEQFLPKRSDLRWNYLTNYPKSNLAREEENSYDASCFDDMFRLMMSKIGDQSRGDDLREHILIHGAGNLRNVETVQSICRYIHGDSVLDKHATRGIHKKIDEHLGSLGLPTPERDSQGQTICDRYRGSIQALSDFIALQRFDDPDRAEKVKGVLVTSLFGMPDVALGRRARDVAADLGITDDGLVLDLVRFEAYGRIRSLDLE